MASLPEYGPPLPPYFSVEQRSRRWRRLLTLYVIARVLVFLAIGRERAEESYTRGLIRSHFRSMFMDRHWSLLDAEFIIVFRMSRRSMEQLRHVLYPYLRVRLTADQIEGRAHGNRRPLTVDEKLAMGLMAAGGCTLGGILFAFHVGKTCANFHIMRFFEVVVLSGVGKIEFPSTLHELQSAADAYLSKRSFHPFFHGHIGALDGLAARIPIPKKNEVDNPLSYLTRKGFAAINCQAIADGHEKCIYLSVKACGSTHDSTAWSVSTKSKQWKVTHVVDPRTGRVFWISLDEAYQATVNQVPPWPGTGLITRAPFKDSFNYHLSAGCRNGVERLFGQVYQRWGILWRPLRFPVKKIPTVLLAIFQLHNFLKDQDERELPDVGTGLGERQLGELLRAADVTEGYDHDYHPSDTCHREEVTLPRVRHGQCPIREEITDALEREGITRPNVGYHGLVEGL